MVEYKRVLHLSGTVTLAVAGTGMSRELAYGNGKIRIVGVAGDEVVYCVKPEFARDPVTSGYGTPYLTYGNHLAVSPPEYAFIAELLKRHTQARAPFGDRFVKAYEAAQSVAFDESEHGVALRKAYARGAEDVAHARSNPFNKPTPENNFEATFSSGYKAPLAVYNAIVQGDAAARILREYTQSDVMATLANFKSISFQDRAILFESDFDAYEYAGTVSGRYSGRYDNYSNKKDNMANDESWIHLKVNRTEEHREAYNKAVRAIRNSTDEIIDKLQSTHDSGCDLNSTPNYELTLYTFDSAVSVALVHRVSNAGVAGYRISVNVTPDLAFQLSVVKPTFDEAREELRWVLSQLHKLTP